MSPVEQYLDSLPPGAGVGTTHLRWWVLFERCLIYVGRNKEAFCGERRCVYYYIRLFSLAYTMTSPATKGAKHSDTIPEQNRPNKRANEDRICVLTSCPWFLAFIARLV